MGCVVSDSGRIVSDLGRVKILKCWNMQTQTQPINKRVGESKLKPNLFIKQVIL